MGMPIRDDGVNDGENLTLACRNALLNMIDLLQERGWSREQAYVLCSVAADLRISNVVDVPNYVVSALIPEAIFTEAALGKEALNQLVFENAVSLYKIPVTAPAAIR